MKKVLIIGAGFSGLSLAALLKHSGFDVTVFEKNNECGGRARLWEKDGFKFDMGPSWYLMPEVFDNFFSVFNKKSSDYYELERLDCSYKVFFDKDDYVDVKSHPDELFNIFEKIEQGSGNKLKNYLEQSEKKYTTALDEFLYRDYTSFFDFINKRTIIDGLKLNVFGSLDKFIGKNFKNRRLKQLLEYTMVFLGTAPKDAPAMYSMMSHIDMKQGVFYPHGGLNKVADSIKDLCIELGVEIITNTNIDKININNSIAESVQSNGKTFKGDILISSADYPYIELNCIEKKYRTFNSKYWESRKIAPSMFILYLGLDKKLDKLSHHNLYFSENWNKHFNSIFNCPELPENPCFYLSCISKTDKDSAPANHENVFVLVPIAPGLDINSEASEKYKDYIIQHIENICSEKINEHIKTSRIFTVEDFEKDYNAYKGTALGLSHNLMQTALFRPAHKSKKIKNLFYTGQYTHPGVGVPMVLISSQITADIITKDF